MRENFTIQEFRPQEQDQVQDIEGGNFFKEVLNDIDRYKNKIN